MCWGSDPQGRPYPFLHLAPAATFERANRTYSPGRITRLCLRGLEAVAWQGYAFCHYQHPDETGHVHGGDSPEYAASLRTLDAELGRLLAALPPETIVLVTSDHGFERADGVEQDWDPRPRRTRFGMTHRWSPNAIIAANRPLAGRASGRDVFKTILELLGETPPGYPGRSLVP